MSGFVGEPTPGFVYVFTGISLSVNRHIRSVSEDSHRKLTASTIKRTKISKSEVLASALCRFMLHTAGALLAYAYKAPKTWDRMLDDLILGMYQKSGAPIRDLIQECVNQVLNEAEQSQECQSSPDTDHHSPGAETTK